MTIIRKGKDGWFTPENLKILFHKRPVTDPNHVEIIGRSSCGGYVIIKPRPDEDARTKADMVKYCSDWFPLIQNKCPDMADYELVEPMSAIFFNAWSIFGHFNFKAKLKNGDDSSAAVFFAEIDMVNKEVMCTKLDIDPSAGYDSYPHCRFCHPDNDEPCLVYSYHPPETIGWLGAR